MLSACGANVLEINVLCYTRQPFSYPLLRTWSWRWIQRAFRAIIGLVPKLLKWWGSTASEVTDELLKAFGAIAVSPKFGRT